MGNDHNLPEGCVVTVDIGGKVKAVGVGNATITATTSNGFVAKCEINVK